MYKHLFRVMLGTIGVMGVLVMGITNAQSEITNSHNVVFDANGGSFSDGESMKAVEGNVIEISPIIYSHTANINDDGVASSVYASNLSTNDVVTIQGARSLDIEVRFSTESASYDWLAIYPAGITPTASNYSSATISNGKLAGHGSYKNYTKPNDTDTTYHRVFTVSGDTVQFYFKSDGSTAYYGYYAIVKGTGYECEYDIQNPTREGYVFNGWYLDEEFTQEFNLSQCFTENTTVYAKWHDERCGTDLNLDYDEDNELCYKKDTTYYNIPIYYGTDMNSSHSYNNNPIGTITVKLPDKNTITMMDMNLGAVNSGSLCSQTNTGACGYHFQWLNNHGFEPCYTSYDCNGFSNGILTGTSPDYENYWPGHPYDDFYFRTTTRNVAKIGNKDVKNFGAIWGGIDGEDYGGINNGDTRQGPCPDGYHVPSIKERDAFLTFFASELGIDIGTSRLHRFRDSRLGSIFKNALKLPFAGFRQWQGNIAQFGSYGEYWSSTRDGSVYSTSAFSFHLASAEVSTAIQASTRDWRMGVSVRCFKDSSKAPETLTITFDENGGKLLGTTIGTLDQLVASGHLVQQPVNPTKTGATFKNWTKTPNGGDIFNFGIGLASGITLYAQYTCNPGYIEIDGECVELYTITYNLNGGVLSGDNKNITQYTIKSGSITLINPIKTGYTFTGRSGTDIEGLSFSVVIPSGSAGDRNYEANWMPNVYTIMFVDLSGAEISVVYSGDYNSAVNTEYPKWTKEGYKIHWDKEIPLTMPLSGDTITASWIPNEYAITFADGSGTETSVVYSGDYNSTVNTEYPKWTKEGYKIHWDKEIPPTMPLSGDTITANWTINQYTITFDTDGGSTIASITENYGTSIKAPANPTKNGYTFKGWDKPVPSTMPAENITIKATWEKVSGGSSGGGGGGGGGGGSSSSCKNLPANAVANNNSIPSSNTNYYYSTNTSKVCTFQCKSGYTRNEEKEICDKSSDTQTTTSGTNIKEPESSTGNNTKVETGNNTEIQTGSKIDTSEQTPQNDNSNTQDSSTSSQNDGKTYAQEFQEAYEFAKGNGITTMSTIQKADMNGKLTRIAMAKMLSQYAMNVLGQKPANIVTPKFNDVTDKQNSDYDDGVTLAYQLGIMGQNMPNNKFRPNDEVTRAEFATALSRMVYHTSDGEYKSTPKYYIHHMEKLVKEGIITKDDPGMKELRGYVMIMLMRSAK